MKKLFFLAFVFLFVFFACSHKDRIPDGILPKEKMESVMWDMIRAGEFLDGFVLKDTSINKTSENLKWYDKIYHIHGVTKGEFIKSYHYYREHSSLMKNILDSLAKRDITTQSNTLQTQPPPPTQDTSNINKPLLPQKDSIRSISDSVKKYKKLNSIRVR